MAHRVRGREAHNLSLAAARPPAAPAGAATRGSSLPRSANATCLLPALTAFVLCWRDTVGIYKNNTVYLQTFVHACFVEHKAPTPEIILYIMNRRNIPSLLGFVISFL